MNTPTIGVYIIINPKGRKYIGKSINIERRFKGYAAGRCKTQTKLYHSILKYGWDKHEKVVWVCKEKDIDSIERYYISWWSTTKYGLNCLSGGGGIRPTAEQIKKMSESKKGLMAGDKNPMYGKKWTQERRDRQSEIAKNISDETRRKISIGNTGRVFSKESREKKSKSLMGHPVSEQVREKLREARSFKVLQFNKYGVFIKEFTSAKSARLETGCHNVSECAAGKLKTSGGFIWKYKKDI